MAVSNDDDDVSMNLIGPAEKKRRIAAAEPNRSDLDKTSMPASVQRRYVQSGQQFLLPSGERTFVDHGSKLTTKSENTTIIQDLVSIASARGWEEIVVAGTKAFRRDAWHAARLAGLEVSGYTPTSVERALLVRAAAETSQARSGAPRDKASNSRSKVSQESPLLTGRLLDHGPAYDDNNVMSYFVKLKTKQGERMVWGADLERSIRHSLTDVQVGDEIGLRALPRRTGDDAQAQNEARRPGWIVEQRRFFNDRVVLANAFRDADLDQREAIKRHPELKGSYLVLQAARLQADESIKHPDDRTAFVRDVRTRLADAMERGEPLTPVRMRERIAERDMDLPGKSPEFTR